MNQFYVTLNLVIIIANFSSATRRTVIKQKPPRTVNEFSSRNPQEQTNPVASPSVNRVPIDETYHMPEIHYSLDSYNEQAINYESDLSLMVENYIDQPITTEVKSEKRFELKMPIDDPQKKSQFPEMELSSIIDDLIATNTIKVNPKGYEDIDNILQSLAVEKYTKTTALFLDKSTESRISKPSLSANQQSPEEHLNSNLMTELIPDTEVMINQNKLKKIIAKYRNQPRNMIQELFVELIPGNELATMTATSRMGSKGVPENIRYTVQEFVDRTAQPRVSNNYFMVVLHKFLKKMRNARNLSGEKKSVDTNIKKLTVTSMLEDPNLKVELMLGSGVMIKKKTLNDLVALYQYSSSKLLRGLVIELIPHKQITSIRVTNGIKHLSIPDNVRTAIGAFLSEVAEPKLDHRLFMESVTSCLRTLQEDLMAAKEKRKNKIE